MSRPALALCCPPGGINPLLVVACREVALPGWHYLPRLASQPVQCQPGGGRGPGPGVLQEGAPEATAPVLGHVYGNA